MLKKKFFKTKDTCQVTFQLPKEVEAKEVALVGEFNSWDSEATLLKKVKGVWKTTLQLEKGNTYQFRYLVDGQQWLNDEAADSYTPNEIDGDNCVVETFNGQK